MANGTVHTGQVQLWMEVYGGSQLLPCISTKSIRRDGNHGIYMFSPPKQASCVRRVTSKVSCIYSLSMNEDARNIAPHVHLIFPRFTNALIIVGPLLWPS
jgi:hypothetical protein